MCLTDTEVPRIVGKIFYCMFAEIFIIVRSSATLWNFAALICSIIIN